MISFSIYKTFFQSDNLGLGSVMSVVSLLLITFLTILALAAFRNRKLND